MQQPLGHSLVASTLDESIETDTGLIHRSPQPALHTGDLERDLIEMPFVADARQATTDPVGQLLAAPELYPLPGPLPSRQWRVLRLSEEFSCHFSAPGREYMHLYECSYSHIKGHAVDRSWVSCLDNLDLNGASVVNAKLSRSREIVIASAAKQSRWRRV